MNEYKLDDAQKLLNQAGELNQLNNDMARVKEKLSSYCYEISANWTSDTEDRNKYLSGITKNIEKLDYLIKANGTLAADLIQFAEETIRIANNG